MSDLALRNRLVRVASTLPKNSSERRVLVAFLKEQESVRVAANQKTQDFVEWVFNSSPDPLPARAVEAFLVQKLGMEIKPPLQKREGPRFQDGDRVKVDASKHKDDATVAPYAEYDKKLGTVVRTNGMDALVKLDSGPSEPVRFEGALSPRGVGLFKYTPPYVLEGSPAIEMAYLADPENAVKSEQQLVVEQYLGKARGTEKRSANYYTGHLFNARENKSGQAYFQMFPQQRMTIDPEGGYLPRSFNPTTGKVLYIGLMNRRPAGWEGELEDLRAKQGLTPA
jgi:hypothetical protein